MRSSIPVLMTEPTRGVLDTSVLIDHDLIVAERLPDESAITAVTLAELAAGPHATENNDERARRQDRLQWAAATWDPLPFDADSARMYARVFAAARAARTVKHGALRGLAHCLDRCGQWIATLHTQSL